MGGVIKSSYDWLVCRPLRTAGLAALTAVPFAAYHCLFIGPDRSDFFMDSLKVISPAGVFLGAGIAAEFLRTFAYEDEFYQRTRLSDFKKRRAVRNEIKKIDFESLVDEEYLKFQASSSSKAVIDHFLKQAELPDKEEGADRLASLALKRHSAALHSSSALEYMKQNNYDSALIEFDKCIDSKELLPRIYFLDWHLNKLINNADIFVHPRDPSPLMHSAILHLLNSRFDDALYYSTFSKSIAREFNNNFKLEFEYLDALVHLVLKSRISGDVWQDFISEIQKQPALERIAETKNPVRVLKSSRFLSKTAVFKDKEDREELLAEAELTEYVKRILPCKFDVSEPLYVSERPIGGLYTYVMRHVSGDTFLERLKKYDYSSLDSIVDCLACVHAKVPAGIVRKGELDIEFKLKSKLFDSNINLPESLANKVLDNYLPVLNSFKDSVFVYNKDAHPENWLVSDKKIVVLDCENGFLVPQQFDLVNLLEYSDYLLDKHKDQAIRQYVAAYGVYSGKSTVSFHDFRQVYFNAVVHRAISLCVAWSSPYRTSMHAERPKIVANAVHALDRLKEEFPDYFARYNSYYVCLKESLEEIKRLVGVQGHE